MGDIYMARLLDLTLAVQWSIYVEVQNIQQLVTMKIHLVVHHHLHHLHLHHHHLHLLLQTVVGPLISQDINVASRNIGVGQVTARTAVGVSVLKWLRRDTRQQA